MLRRKYISFYPLPVIFVGSCSDCGQPNTWDFFGGYGAAGALSASSRRSPRASLAQVAGAAASHPNVWRAPGAISGLSPARSLQKGVQPDACSANGDVLLKMCPLPAACTGPVQEEVNAEGASGVREEGYTNSKYVRVASLASEEASEN